MRRTTPSIRAVLHGIYEDFLFSTSTFIAGLKKPEREANTLPQYSAVRSASLRGA